MLIIAYMVLDRAGGLVYVKKKKGNNYIVCFNERKIRQYIQKSLSKGSFMTNVLSNLAIFIDNKIYIKVITA